MTLTNYWWLLIWLFAGGAITGAFPKKQERLNGESVERWGCLPAISLVLPYIIWAGFRVSFGDTGTYRRVFLALSASISDIPELLSKDTKDPGFTVLMILIKTVIGNQDTLFFLIIAAFQMLCIAAVFRKYSTDYWICIFLFVASTDYLSWVQNGMRQFIAIAAIFAGFKWMVQKRYVPLIALILVASLIHGSALLMIPVVFIVQGNAWNKKTILMLLATMVVIAFVDRFTPILNDLLQDTQYNDMVTNEIWTTDDGTNILRVAVYSVPAIMSLVGLRYVRAANDPVINICVNCSIVTMALYGVASVSSGIYIGRLPMYTTLQGYIALPWLIDHMFTKDSARLVKWIMIYLFLAFFYFQMHVAWGAI